MSLSRIAALALVGILVPAAASAQSEGVALDRYAALTSVEPRCVRPSNDSEILVCGARRADRWRVPFVGYDAGDPRGETVEGERKLLASEPPRKCGNEWALRNCGSVGIAATIGFGASGTDVKWRPLAP